MEKRQAVPVFFVRYSNYYLLRITFVQLNPSWQYPFFAFISSFKKIFLIMFHQPAHNFTDKVCGSGCAEGDGTERAGEKEADYTGGDNV